MKRLAICGLLLRKGYGTDSTRRTGKGVCLIEAFVSTHLYRRGPTLPRSYHTASQDLVYATLLAVKLVSHAPRPVRDSREPWPRTPLRLIEPMPPIVLTEFSDETA